MNGCMIPYTPVAVDLWRPRKCSKLLLHFLSHVPLDDQSFGLSANWTSPIYCSPISKKLLTRRFQMDADVIRELELNVPNVIPLTSAGDVTITVTLLDARHCPGSVMFVFDGYFGRILYTGSFRYEEGMLDAGFLTELKATPVDVLYIDNTLCSQKCVLPSRQEAESEIASIIDQHRSERVVFGLRGLGKVDVLITLAKRFGVKVTVSEEWYHLLEVVGMHEQFVVAYEGVERARFEVVELVEVTRTSVDTWNKAAPTIAVLLTGLFVGLGYQPFTGSPDIFVVALSEHSSYTELHEFVTKIRPRSVVPIVRTDPGCCEDPLAGSLLDRTNVECFADHLDPSPMQNYHIPASVLELMNESGNVASRTRQRRSRSLSATAVQDCPGNISRLDLHATEHSPLDGHILASESPVVSAKSVRTPSLSECAQSQCAHTCNCGNCAKILSGRRLNGTVQHVKPSVASINQYFMSRVINQRQSRWLDLLMKRRCIKDVQQQPFNWHLQSDSHVVSTAAASQQHATPAAAAAMLATQPGSENDTQTGMCHSHGILTTSSSSARHCSGKGVAISTSRPDSSSNKNLAMCARSQSRRPSSKVFQPACSVTGRSDTGRMLMCSREQLAERCSTDVNVVFANGSALNDGDVVTELRDEAGTALNLSTNSSTAVRQAGDVTGSLFISPSVTGKHVDVGMEESGDDCSLDCRRPTPSTLTPGELFRVMVWDPVQFHIDRSIEGDGDLFPCAGDICVTHGTTSHRSTAVDNELPYAAAESEASVQQLSQDVIPCSNSMLLLNTSTAVDCSVISNAGVLNPSANVITQAMQAGATDREIVIHSDRQLKCAGLVPCTQGENIQQSRSVAVKSRVASLIHPKKKWRREFRAAQLSQRCHQENRDVFPSRLLQCALPVNPPHAASGSKRFCRGIRARSTQQSSDACSLSKRIPLLTTYSGATAAGGLALGLHSSTTSAGSAVRCHAGDGRDSAAASDCMPQDVFCRRDWSARMKEQLETSVLKCSHRDQHAVAAAAFPLDLSVCRRLFARDDCRLDIDKR